MLGIELVALRFRQGWNRDPLALALSPLQQLEFLDLTRFSGQFTVGAQAP